MLPLQLITQTKWDDVRIIFFNLVKKLGIDSKMKTGEIIDKWRGVLRIYMRIILFESYRGILSKATIYNNKLMSV